MTNTTYLTSTFISLALAIDNDQAILKTRACTERKRFQAPQDL